MAPIIIGTLVISAGTAGCDSSASGAPDPESHTRTHVRVHHTKIHPGVPAFTLSVHDPGPPRLRQRVVRRHWPALYRATQRAKDPNWNVMERAAQRRWLRTHRHSNAYLYDLWRRTGDAARVIDATWRADGAPGWKIRIWRCIPQYEGGARRSWPGTIDVMDRMYGPGQNKRVSTHGAPPGSDVLNPWQIKPGWAAAYEAELAGGTFHYGADSWTPNRIRLATNPVSAARITERIGLDQYATIGNCM